MTEKQKKLAIIAIVILGLLFFFMPKKASGSTVVNQGSVPDINVSIPSMNIPERSPFAINIPGLPSFTPYQYSAVSPCMCNGASQAATPYSGPLITYVTNMGNSGPNVYNYSAPSQSHGDFTGVYIG